MAKYSLWITDAHRNTFIVPLQRNGQKTKEKVHLYEIDLLTVSLGKTQFVQCLKQSKIPPSQFDWSTAIGYIQYKVQGENKYLPLLFERDVLLMQFLNFQNQYHYHKNMTEIQMRGRMLSKNATTDLKDMLAKLGTYSDFLIESVCKYQFDYLNSQLPKKIKRKLYCYMHSTNLEEQIEYRNDLVREFISYLNFRKVKIVEFNKQIGEKLETFPISDTMEENENEEFLTEEEKKMMYGMEESEKVYGKTYH